MPNKEDVLKRISELSREGSITKKELESAFEKGKTPGERASSKSLTVFEKVQLGSSLTQVGGLVVVLAVIFLFSLNWGDLTSFVRIFVSLGLGLIIHAIAYYSHGKSNLQNLAVPFYLISSILVPVGLLVLFYELGYSLVGGYSTFLAFTLSLLLFGLTSLKRPISELKYFNLFLGTVWLYSLMYYIGEIFSYDFELDFYVYLTIGVGIFYLALSLWVAKKFSDFMKFTSYLGSLLVYSSLFYFIIFDKVFENNFFAVYLSGPSFSIWEVVMIAALALGYYLSARFQNKFILHNTTAFLILYVFYLPIHHFVSDLGWSFTLLVVGFLLIGVGYLFMRTKESIENNGSPPSPKRV